MNKPTKITLLALLLLLALPMRHFAQTPYRQYSEEGVVLNFHTIDNVYFRSFLLYNISNDNRFVLIPEETFGQFIITPKYDDSHFMDEFESLTRRDINDDNNALFYEKSRDARRAYLIVKNLMIDPIREFHNNDNTDDIFIKKLG